MMHESATWLLLVDVTASGHSSLTAGSCTFRLSITQVSS